MPFKSVAQRKFMFAKHPQIARRWVHKYGAKIGGGKMKSHSKGKK